MNRLETAMWWYGQGVNVLPVQFRGKRPLTRWKTWQNRRQPLKLVKQWFGKDFVPINIGVICSGKLVVLDFDKPGEYMKWKLAPERKWCESFTVKTSRGWHVYFWIEKCPRTTLQMDGGQVKANGYVVTAPSTHESGFAYQIVCEAPILKVASLEQIGVQCVLPSRKQGDNFLPENTRYGDDLGIVAKIKLNIKIDAYLKRITRLSWNGQDLMAICPFHDDRRPSMIVHTDEGWVYCFSPDCKAHRRLDVIDVLALYWEINVNDAISLLSMEVD